MLLAATQPELFDRAQWFAAAPARREQLARAVADLLLPDFELLGLRSYAGTDLEIAVYRHLASGQRFSLIPGGGFEMGMSPEEEQAIVDARPEVRDDEDDFDHEFDLLLSEMGTMRPVHVVELPPFLLAQRVLTVGQVRRYIDGFVDPLYGGEPGVPAHLSSEQATAVLVGTGLRLPSEAELEGAVRGHLRRSLLPTATRVPDEDTLEAMLADAGDATSNAFGIHGYGLYPERCADAWHEHYKGAPVDGSAWSGPGPRVVRGGAANCYPWQGCGEWNVMLCAFRMSDHAAEFGAALRPARSLRPHAALGEPEHAVPAAHPGTAAAPPLAPRAPAAATPATEPSAARASAEKRPAATRAAARKPAAPAKLSAEQPAAKTASAKKPTAKKPTAKTASAKKPSAKTASAKKPTAKTASAKKPSAKTASAKKPSAKTPTAKTASAKKPTAKTPTAKKPSAKKPTAKTASAKKPTAKTASARTASAKKPPLAAGRPVRGHDL